MKNNLRILALCLVGMFAANCSSDDNSITNKTITEEEISLMSPDEIHKKITGKWELIKLTDVETGENITLTDTETPYVNESEEFYSTLHFTGSSLLVFQLQYDKQVYIYCLEQNKQNSNDDEVNKCTYETYRGKYLVNSGGYIKITYDGSGSQHYHPNRTVKIKEFSENTLILYVVDTKMHVNAFETYQRLK
ncbi:hypothetical protein ACKLNQ_07145 [Myroides odoratimimus]|uniref:hypothetical protein n=1 Tax=Myroides TaxID=76831 RepID=UPI0028B16DF1|nr:hypothetical protein [Myroides sp.]